MIKIKRKQWQGIIAFALLPLFILSSCNQTKSDKGVVAETLDIVAQKRSEVMAVHDAIMPKIGTLMSLKRQLKEKAATLDNTSSAHKEQLDSIRLSIEQLEAADEAMMQWMRTYKDPADSVSDEEAIGYLEIKEQEILEVKEEMLESERAAQALLNDH
ncbi:hypothetical protein [Nafulsella turpanensis]|uniref:hypothetical protein n=1 Tax=Nafulsella turpanensis TaxID=1265690 RepID=UPI00034986D6|nr:hypothetical protein [Nafulsella turpanensis]